MVCMLSSRGSTAISEPLLAKPSLLMMPTVKKSCLKATQFVLPSNFLLSALLSLR